MRTLSLILSLFAGLSAVIAGEPFVRESDVPYVFDKDSPADSRQKLDIYHPESPDGKALPVVVWFHGGGLTGGDRHIPAELTTGDYVVAAAGYRLMPTVNIKGCLEDAAAALAWVMDSIDTRGGDPQRIYLSGHSAGGYLSSMLALDRSWLAAHGKNPDSLAAVIPFSPQAITHFAHRRSIGLSELTPLVDSLAPLRHIRPDAPPYIVVTGDRELELYGRYEENAYMVRMMRLAGHKATELYELDGFDHGAMASPAFHILRGVIERYPGKK